MLPGLQTQGQFPVQVLVLTAADADQNVEISAAVGAATG